MLESVGERAGIAAPPVKAMLDAPPVFRTRRKGKHLGERFGLSPRVIEAGLLLPCRWL
jgi:hypothetical protein